MFDGCVFICVECLDQSADWKENLLLLYFAHVLLVGCVWRCLNGCGGGWVVGVVVLSVCYAIIFITAISFLVNRIMDPDF